MESESGMKRRMKNESKTKVGGLEIFVNRKKIPLHYIPLFLVLTLFNITWFV